MKRYEGFLILETAGKEENIKEAIDKISEEIKAVQGRVEGVQKMDKKPFARGDSDRKEGYYVNIIFQAPPGSLPALRNKVALTGLVYRQLYTCEAPPSRVKAKPLAETKATS
jgi:ribosomal protein S6